ncbi:aspartyl-phosphate phosphatase Spo0E family protein [Halalkalibacter akibai]|uniref:Aspartyl-phosphate phosphatase Spo0E family protein n=1 Tax=Halalkalibacter akibai (strain ATCC 43226 / DSM 21942 / CIP 109018 / JCM 9157 / 1139) TaxID=1236973 RepID=W4QRI9_HALA3|nr:aspartyl-phosphate phosphatase Spo0E family protein [Halalkalibacter akibai]GAE34716.1 hypothetical protein JCM9157_1791 [Halalkalibacter akibai JCM 9157]
MSERLLDIIEIKRRELIELASLKGLSSQAVLALSQELDALLNHYNHMTTKENHFPK